VFHRKLMDPSSSNKRPLRDSYDNRLVKTLAKCQDHGNTGLERC